MKQKMYYPIDRDSLEVLPPMYAEHRGGIYHIPRGVLQSEPLPPREGYAVIAVLGQNGCAIDSKYIEDHRGRTIYQESDCTKMKLVTDLGPIEADWTDDKPATPFDERIENQWVTNQSNKYYAEFNQAVNTRADAYRALSDQLFMAAYRREKEAKLKRTQGQIAKAEALEKEAEEYSIQGVALVEKIKADNPDPTPPQA